MSVNSHHDKISAIADAATAWIGDQVLLSQGRCVDVFLDMYLATDNLSLRWSIEDRLSEIRLLGAVRADEMRSDLAAIVALADTGELVDMAWAEDLLAASSPAEVGSPFVS